MHKRLRVLRDAAYLCASCAFSWRLTYLCNLPMLRIRLLSSRSLRTGTSALPVISRVLNPDADDTDLILRTLSSLPQRLPRSH